MSLVMKSTLSKKDRLDVGVFIRVNDILRQLKYPVLLYSPRYVLGRIDSEKELRVVGEKNFAEGCFENASIVDSGGFKSNVLDARIERWVRSIWSLFPQYRYVWVALELSEPKKIELNHLKKDLINLISKNNLYPKAQGIARSEIDKSIQSPSNFSELIRSIVVFS